MSSRQMHRFQRSMPGNCLPLPIHRHLEQRSQKWKKGQSLRDGVYSTAAPSGQVIVCPAPFTDTWSKDLRRGRRVIHRDVWSTPPQRHLARLLCAPPHSLTPGAMILEGKEGPVTEKFGLLHRSAIWPGYCVPFPIHRHLEQRS